MFLLPSSFLVSCLAKSSSHNVINEDHIREREGLVIIIVLGEVRQRERVKRREKEEKEYCVCRNLQ